MDGGRLSITALLHSVTNGTLSSEVSSFQPLQQLKRVNDATKSTVEKLHFNESEVKKYLVISNYDSSPIESRPTLFRDVSNRKNGRHLQSVNKI